MDDNEYFINNDDEIDYVSDMKHLEDNTQRRKSVDVVTINSTGDALLDEIDKKKKKSILKINKLIPYILKHSDDTYNKDELISYSYGDVKTIYDEIKQDRKPIIIEMFEFIFNVK